MTIFTCPCCGRPLQEEATRWYCPAGHSFDKARSGYVNLLLPGGKHAKLPGDNKQMVAARKAFLDKGYYRPMAESLCGRAAGLLQKSGVVLDAGCGEGYYTAQLASALERSGKEAAVYGVDISKFALAAAGRRFSPGGTGPQGVRLAAASVFHLPVQAGSCDLLLNLFAPYCGEEFLRVLKPRGLMAMVIPGRRHLWELKEAVYDHPYENEVRDYPLMGFDFLESIPVAYEITLTSPEEIQSLFQMTPYYYKTSVEGQQRAAALTELTTRVEFEILLYQKSI